jgi:hypothetical protein
MAHLERPNGRDRQHMSTGARRQCRAAQIRSVTRTLAIRFTRPMKLRSPWSRTSILAWLGARPRAWQPTAVASCTEPASTIVDLGMRGGGAACLGGRPPGGSGSREVCGTRRWSALRPDPLIINRLEESEVSAAPETAPVPRGVVIAVDPSQGVLDRRGRYCEPGRGGGDTRRGQPRRLSAAATLRRRPTRCPLGDRGRGRTGRAAGRAATRGRDHGRRRAGEAAPARAAALDRPRPQERLGRRAVGGHRRMVGAGTTNCADRPGDRRPASGDRAP